MGNDAKTYNTGGPADLKQELDQRAATSISRRLAPGGGGGGAWLGGPKTESSDKYGNEKKFHVLGTNLFGDEVKALTSSKLRERFDFAPFSVLNAREGAWQDRKNAWLSLGLKSEVGRGENLLKMSDTVLEPDPEKRAALRAARLEAGLSEDDTAAIEASGGTGTSIFDPVLAEMSYRWFCPPGGLILDPFAGGSVRGIVAGLLGFRYVGIDLRPEQIAANEQQKADIVPDADIRWLLGDANIVLDSAPDADFIFSCPPYGDLEQYSDDPDDLSSMTWDGFCKIYRSIITKAVARLKPDRFASFVVGEFRDKETGCYRGFVPYTAACFQAAGAALYNEAVLITSVGSLPIRVVKQFGVSRKLGKTHQNMLISVKGDPRRATAAINNGLPPALSMPTAPQTLRGPAPAAPPKSLWAPGTPAVTAESGGSLADFLKMTPRSSTITWKAEEPPSLEGIDEVVLNFATTGLEWTQGARPCGVTVSTLDGRLCRFLPFGFAAGNLDEATVKRWAERELRGKKIYNANTRFDLHMAREWGVDLEEQGCTFSDIAHTAALLDDHRRKFALDTLAADYLNDQTPIARLDENRHQTYEAGEAAAREEYTAKLVGRLQAVMYPELDKQELRKVQDLEDAVIPCAVEMEKNGALINLELLEEYHKRCHTTHDSLMWDITRELGFPFEHSASGWQRMLERLQITPPDSFSEGALATINHPLVQKAQKAAQYASLNSKIFDAYKKRVDSNGILRFDLHQLRGDDGGTVSGRFSAPYIQQVPNKGNHHAAFGDDLFPRRLYMSATGRYLAADAAQIQYRIFAHHANNPRILKMYEENPRASFHRMIEGLLRPHKPDILYEQVKNINFMKIFGGGLAKLALMMGHITAEQFDDIMKPGQNWKRWDDPRLAKAKEVQQIYERELPEVGPLLRKAKHLAMMKCDDDCFKNAEGQMLHQQFPHRGFVKTVLGRRSRFPDNFKLYKAFCMVDQGSEGDIVKTKIVELHKARKQTGFVMRMTVHDEIAGDAKDEQTLSKVDAILNHQSFPELRIPILWDCAEGQNWADCK